MAKEFSSLEIQGIKTETLRGLKNLFLSTQDSEFFEKAKEEYKRYGEKASLSRRSTEAVAELYTIVGKELKISNPIAIHTILHSMVLIAYDSIKGLEGYDHEEIAQVVVRKMLMMIGVENERLVTNLSRFWILPMMSRKENEDEIS